jgi:hypothetical protein
MPGRGADYLSAPEAASAQIGENVPAIVAKDKDRTLSPDCVAVVLRGQQIGNPPIHHFRAFDGVR